MLCLVRDYIGKKVLVSSNNSNGNTLTGVLVRDKDNDNNIVGVAYSLDWWAIILDSFIACRIDISDQSISVGVKGASSHGIDNGDYADSIGHNEEESNLNVHNEDNNIINHSATGDESNHSSPDDINDSIAIVHGGNIGTLSRRFKHRLNPKPSFGGNAELMVSSCKAEHKEDDIEVFSKVGVVECNGNNR